LEELPECCLICASRSRRRSSRVSNSARTDAGVVIQSSGGIPGGGALSSIQRSIAASLSDVKRSGYCWHPSERLPFELRWRHTPDEDDDEHFFDLLTGPPRCRRAG
jgi:hypothetical protein